MAVLAATAGFVPLHMVWAMGIPLLADAGRFEVWHADGGGVHLWTLNVLALLPVVMAFALTRPWGMVFPRWVPEFGGRKVPRLLLIVPGCVLVAVLSGYTMLTVVLSSVGWDNPIIPWDGPESVRWDGSAGIFSPWTGVYGITQFIVWITALTTAIHSYAVRTRR